MVWTQNPVATRVKVPQGTFTQISNSTGGNTWVNLFTANTNNTKLVGIIITNTDTAAHVVQISGSNGTVNFFIGSANVAGNSGYDGVTNSVSFFNQSTMVNTLPQDNDGQSYLFVPAGNSIQAQVTTAMPFGKIMNFTSIYADF
jgi:hypothetical protein